MPIDPRNLKPADLARLLNSTPLGTVILRKRVHPAADLVKARARVLGKQPSDRQLRFKAGPVVEFVDHYVVQFLVERKGTLTPREIVERRRALGCECRRRGRRCLQPGP